MPTFNNRPAPLDD